MISICFSQITTKSVFTAEDDDSSQSLAALIAAKTEPKGLGKHDAWLMSLFFTHFISFSFYFILYYFNTVTPLAKAALHGAFAIYNLQVQFSLDPQCDNSH